jgi:hypothetical protein
VTGDGSSHNLRTQSCRRQQCAKPERAASERDIIDRFIRTPENLKIAPDQPMTSCVRPLLASTPAAHAAIAAGNLDSPIQLYSVVHRQTPISQIRA